jgi:predicted transcriptional regulator
MLVGSCVGFGVDVRGFGELEAAIMDRVWARGEPMKVRDVLAELQPERDLAYNTVLTVMDILYRKGWLTRERDGRAHRYAPTVSREEYGARLMRDALDDAGDPAEALVRFVGRMSTSEAAALRQALQAHERGEGR